MKGHVLLCPADFNICKLTDLRDCHTFASLFWSALLERGHIRILPQRIAHYLAQFARSFAVDDTHERQPRGIGLIKITLELVKRIFGDLAADIQFKAGGLNGNDGR